MTLCRRLSEMRLAMMMLTRLPMGRLRDPVPQMAEARWAFPLAGVPVGLAGWGILCTADAVGLGGLAAALLALGGMVALTGGLHHDGLADFVDSMGGRDRAQRLEIMRDSRIGSYGVVALIFAVGLSAAALAATPMSAWAGFILVAMASRLAMLIVLDVMPPSRPDGLGRMAAPASDGTLWRVWLPGSLLCGLAALALGADAMPILVAMALCAAFVAWRAHRLIGGQTGDVLGAVQLTSETAGWLVLSALL